MSAPVFQIREGSIKGCIWAKQGNSGGMQYSISIEKSYKDKQTNEWKSTNFYYDNEISSLIYINEVLRDEVRHLKKQQQSQQPMQQQPTQQGQQQNYQPPQDPWKDSYGPGNQGFGG